MNFVEELRWRGMLHDMMPGTEELLNKEKVTAYIGFDPTADSLHIGHLCSVMILRHFQRCGHKPLALIGGATGMIGDPSGKSAERNLLNEETLQRNIAGMKKQLSKFLDFESDAPNKAELVNNYDWMKDYTFLDFAREIGKHITVNYMMAKDSVKKRLNGEARDGLSFTEFTYQLLQGYDFLHLYETKGCKLQMGGSDQWGNITTGSELIRYKFYQFWMNVSDADAERYIKIFTDLPREEIEALIEEQHKDPGLRPIQKRLAKEVTTMVHSAEAYDAAVEASQILFSKNATEQLHKVDEATLLDIFEGVDRFNVSRSALDGTVKLIDLLTETVPVFPSKGELRKLAQQNGLSINKEKVTDVNATATDSLLLAGKYILVQKGKKQYYLLIVE